MSEIIFRGQGYAILKIDKSDNLYVVASEYGKPRLYQSLGTAQLMEAKAEARARYREYIRTGRAKAGRKLLEDYWKDYLLLEEAKIVTGELDEVTLRRKKNAWARCEPYWAGMTADELTNKNFKFFAAYLEKQHPGCSLQPEHKYLQALANYLFAEGKIERKVQLELGKEKSKTLEERRKISDAEIKRLLEACESAKPDIKLMVYCGIYHGMRISEVAKMKRENIFKEAGRWHLYLEDTKTDADREIVINEHVLPILLELRDKGRGDWVFPHKKHLDKHRTTNSLDGRWRVLKGKAKVDCVFHELRHTAISNAVKKYELAKVALYFGVSVRVLFDHYVHLEPGDYAEVANSIAVRP